VPAAFLHCIRNSLQHVLCVQGDPILKISFHWPIRLLWKAVTLHSIWFLQHSSRCRAQLSILPNAATNVPIQTLLSPHPR
jgi:hypothetical protein